MSFQRSPYGYSALNQHSKQILRNLQFQSKINSVLLSERAETDLYESMAMVVKSRSKPIGQGDSVAGEVNVGNDIYAEFGFDNNVGGIERSNKT